MSLTGAVDLLGARMAMLSAPEQRTQRALLLSLLWKASGAVGTLEPWERHLLRLLGRGELAELDAQAAEADASGESARILWLLLLLRIAHRECEGGGGGGGAFGVHFNQMGVALASLRRLLHARASARKRLLALGGPHALFPILHSAHAPLRMGAAAALLTLLAAPEATEPTLESLR